MGSIQAKLIRQHLLYKDLWLWGFCWFKTTYWHTARFFYVFKGFIWCDFKFSFLFGVLLGPSNPKIQRGRRVPLLIKEQRDYPGRFKVYFRTSVAQFDALLAILEPHIKKEDHQFLWTQCARIYIQCFVLRDEVDELDNRHSGFWCSLVRWLWTVKTPLKMLATDAKNAKNRTRSEFFYDRRKFRRQCVNMIDNVRSYLFFNVRNFRTKNCNGLKVWFQ